MAATTPAKPLFDSAEWNFETLDRTYDAIQDVALNDLESAFEWLEKAYQDHENEMYWLKVEPPFEPLRSDPRWQVMLDKVGFPVN